MPRFGAPRPGPARRDPPPLAFARPVAEARPAPSRWPRRVAAWLLGSLLAHALVMALLLWEGRRDRLDRGAVAPSVEVVFEDGGAAQPATEPPPGFEVPPAPQAPVIAEAVPAPPQGSAPPAPVTAPRPVPPPAVPPPPTPVPPLPVTVTPPPGAPPPPVAAPAVPAPPFPEARVVPPPMPRPPAPPAVPPPAAQPPAAQPGTAPPPPPAPPGVVAMLPPPPAVPPVPEAPPTEAAETPPLPGVAEILPPTPPLRLRPRFEAPPGEAGPPRQQASPALPPGSVFVPGGVQLGAPARSAPQGRRQAQGLDLTVDPRLAEGTASTDPSVRVIGAQVDAGWSAAFHAWMNQNLRFPMRAAQLGESGTVRVQVIAGPDGQVRSVRLTGPSTSPSLNFGTTFPFSGATLPPFPRGADPNGVTIDLTVNYVLIRR